MTRIRRVQISNFRSIRALDWVPSAGINCLIGPGDSGKSSILDAIDFCLGARRAASFGDTDFFGGQVSSPIAIALTLGALPDSLKSLEVYGEFLRGYNPATGTFEDEPSAGCETTITLRLIVESDLEPSWSLYSDRAAGAGLERGLYWKDRASIASARIGSYASSNFSWNRSSVLNRLTEDKLDLGEELANAARDARLKFGSQASAQLGASLDLVTKTAHGLGVPIGISAQALLDAHSVSINDGAIALHDSAGIPLRLLGTGSSRLLLAGLQRAAAGSASVALVDEVEHGLEPHRLTRLLHSLGAKDSNLPLQVFMTTHSPVAVRELAGNQVFVVRSGGAFHQIFEVGMADDIQSTVRADPEAFLARSVLVCEGASEVGFARGMDQYWVSQGSESFFSRGGAFVDVGGSEPDRCYKRGMALLRLGYRVMVLLDADKVATPSLVAAFRAAGGQELSWRPGRTLEDELFSSLSNTGVQSLLYRAVDFLEAEMVNSHIQSQSSGGMNFASVIAEGQSTGYLPATRALLGVASRKGKNSWFKSVSKFEAVARDIVGPDLKNCDSAFVGLAAQLFTWFHAA
jgi:putative ATP-dependent endonuclease of OLD family